MWFSEDTGTWIARLMLIGMLALVAISVCLLYEVYWLISHVVITII
jgi:hypothetical protein